MYNQDEFSKTKIVAIVLFIFSVISAIITVKYGCSIVNSIPYLLSDAEKAAEITTRSLKGTIIWLIISTISGTIAKFAWYI